MYKVLFLSYVSAAGLYNILTIDGGGIRGIITATCIERMEKFAYDYAKEKNYTITEYKY